MEIIAFLWAPSIIKKGRREFEPLAFLNRVFTRNASLYSDELRMTIKNKSIEPFNENNR